MYININISCFFSSVQALPWHTEFLEPVVSQIAPYSKMLGTGTSTLLQLFKNEKGRIIFFIILNIRNITFNNLNFIFMKTRISFLVFVVIFGISNYKATAQNTERPVGKTKFSIEIDPATYAFKGYSAHLRIQPKASNHLLYGVGIYAMDMPSFFVDMNSNNANKDWQVRINNAVGIFGEYHFSEVNKGFFTGAQISAQQFIIENENQSGEEKFTNGLIMGYGGYTLQPFKFPLYFKAWGGVGYTSKISGDNVLGEQEYDISPLSVFATLHMGYTF
jgi:hypothetical protein